MKRGQCDQNLAAFDRDDLPAQSFDPNAILLEEGETSGLLYVLIDGEVEILKGDFQINLVSNPGARLSSASPRRARSAPARRFSHAGHPTRSKP